MSDTRERSSQADASASVNGTAGTDRTAARRTGTRSLLERYEAASATACKCGRPQLFARLKLARGRYIHLLATRGGIVAREERY